MPEDLAHLGIASPRPAPPVVAAPYVPDSTAPNPYAVAAGSIVIGAIAGGLGTRYLLSDRIIKRPARRGTRART